MTTVARYNKTDAANLKVVEIELLRSQTLVPATPHYDASHPLVAAYMKKLLLVATQYSAQTPSRWSNVQLDGDYIEMRLRIFHGLSTTTLNSLRHISPAECAKQTKVLDEFLAQIK